jgi:UDP-3-O-[3-hydroxymyristoyl] glucosamine N-acyltransferase
MAHTLAELAKHCGGRVSGDETAEIQGVARLESATAGDISYVSEKKYLGLLDSTRAGAVILKEGDQARYRGNAIIAADPHLAYARIAQLLHPLPFPGGAIHKDAVVDPAATVAGSAFVGPTAVVEAGAVIGERVYVGPGCVIGRNARVGDDSWLAARVVVAHECILGERCVVQPGAVIGGDGFGYAQDRERRWIRIPQVGRAILGDDVEIGSNTTVDRGAQGDTIIGNGVKVDNLVQIAHNVELGENTIMAGLSGIAGSTTIGKRCAIGGQAGIHGHITIADDVTVAGRSNLAKTVSKAGVYSSAVRAERLDVWQRIAARIRQLESFAKRLDRIEKRLDKEEQE